MNAICRLSFSFQGHSNSKRQTCGAMDSTQTPSLINSTSWTALRGSTWSWMQNSIATSSQENRNYEKSVRSLTDPAPSSPRPSLPQQPQWGATYSSWFLYTPQRPAPDPPSPRYNRGGIQPFWKRDKNHKKSNLAEKHRKERHKDYTHHLSNCKAFPRLGCAMLASLEMDLISDCHGPLHARPNRMDPRAIRTQRRLCACQPSRLDRCYLLCHAPNIFKLTSI